MKLTSHTGLVAATILLSTAQQVAAHSWVEQLMLISPNGTMTGAAGYIRGFVSRATSGFSDDLDNYLLPPNGRNSDGAVLATDPLCHPSQRTPTYSTDFPMLSASAGDYIALRYQENGHVTLPDTNPTKPLNRGTVYVYGTTEPQTNELFLDVFQKWTADGTGGNGRGRLLATRNFDDGQCYQVNSFPISQKRQADFKKEAENPQGTDLWCQNDIQLPTDLTADSKYTLYWVWSWPTFNKAGSPTDIETDGFNVTTLQYYTSCMDVAVAASSASSKGAADTHNFASSFVTNQDLNSAAVLGQLEVGAFQVAVPGSTGGNTTTTGASSDSISSDGSSSDTDTCADAGTVTTTLTKTVAATATTSSATGDHTVFVTVTQTQAPVTVTVTEVPAGATGGGRTFTGVTSSTIFVTMTISDKPSSASSTGSTSSAANAAATTTDGSVPDRTVIPFLTTSAPATTTFKRVRRQ